MIEIRLFFDVNLQPGYKEIGTINLPIINEKIGYIHLMLNFWIYEIKVAWKIT